MLGGGVCCAAHHSLFFFVLHSSISTSITRGRNLKLFKPQCSLDVPKYSFAYRVIDILNSWSSDTVNAIGISVFKHKLEFIAV